MFEEQAGRGCLFLYSALRRCRFRLISPHCGALLARLPVSAFPGPVKELGPGGSEVTAAAWRGSEGRSPLQPSQSRTQPLPHGPNSETQRVPPAESPGAGLLLAGCRRGAEDEPGHPEGVGVPGDRRRLGMGPRAAGRLAAKPPVGVQFLRVRAPF